MDRPGTVTTEIRGPVAYVRLGRPPLNILNIAMLKELRAALGVLRQATFKVLVVHSQERAFSAGADVAEHLPEQAPQMLKAFHQTIEALMDFPQPTVAAVRGAALGGGAEVALACDFIVMARSATLGQPEIQVGVFPPVAVALLPHLMSNRRAWEVIMTGRPIGADTAMSLGLINRIADEQEFERDLDQFLGTLTGLSASVLRVTKKALRIDDSWRDRLRKIERLYLDELMQQPDAVEGLQAFLEKRRPQWQS